MWINQVHIIHPCLSSFFFLFLFLFLVNQLKDVIGNPSEQEQGGRRSYPPLLAVIFHHSPLLSTTIHYSSTIPPLSPSIKPFPVESFCLFATPETSVSASVCPQVDGSMILGKPWTLTGGFMWNFSSANLLEKSGLVLHNLFTGLKVYICTYVYPWRCLNNIV